MEFAAFRLLEDNISIGKILTVEVLQYLKSVEAYLDTKGTESLHYLENLLKEMSNCRAAQGEPGASMPVQTGYLDMRFRHIYMRDFKSMPLNTDLWFGLDFTGSCNVAYPPDGPEASISPGGNANISAEPVIYSIYAFGENGSGKSTIYSALEYKCTGKVGEASLRGSDSFEAIDYTETPKHNIAAYIGKNHKNATSQLQDNIRIQTVSPVDTFVYYALRPFFCSEYDLIWMTRLIPSGADDDWIPFFAHLSGYGEIETLIQHLTTLDLSIEPSYSDNISGETFGNLIAAAEQAYSKIEKAKLGQEENIHLVEVLSKIASTIKKKYTATKAHGLKETYGQTIRRLIPITQEEKMTQLEVFLRKLIGDAPADSKSKAPKISVAGESQKGAGSISTDLPKEVHAQIETLCHLLQTKIDAAAQDIRCYNKPYDLLQKIREEKTADIFAQSDKAKSAITTLRQRCIEERNNKVYSMFCDHKTRVEEFFTINEFIDSRHERIVYTADDANKSIKFNITHTIDGIEKAHTFYGYLNTFRLKLLMLYLRTLTAFSVMRDEGFAFPLIFDDIFYASDYDNKYKLKGFFISLYHNYRAISADRVKVPLQVIFFTHDEQIMTVCHESLRDTSGIKYAYIYPLRHVQKSGRSEIDFNECDVHRDTTEAGHFFVNLQMPMYEK